MRNFGRKYANMITVAGIIAEMKAMRDDVQREGLMRFFKTGAGQYGEGDEFLGIKVPQVRVVVKHAQGLPLCEVPQLLCSPWHEVRLCGLLLMVAIFEKLSAKRLIDDEKAVHKRDEIVSMYLKYARKANNWDLVDLSAPKIIGHWLMLPSHIGDKQGIMDGLAHSANLWEQRISMVCTWKTLQMGNAEWCLRYAKIHLHHEHDLMHKAVGWMLREMGKRMGMDLLRDFLQHYSKEMPRTTLRYDIEKMDEKERRRWMEKS